MLPTLAAGRADPGSTPRRYDLRGYDILAIIVSANLRPILIVYHLFEFQYSLRPHPSQQGIYHSNGVEMQRML